jgi:Zinc finger, C2H2 type
MPETSSFFLARTQNLSQEESCLPNRPSNQNSLTGTFPVPHNTDWKYIFTIRAGQPSNVLQVAEGPFGIWNYNATTHQCQSTYATLPWNSPLSTWNSDGTSLDSQYSSPVSETPFTSFNHPNVLPAGPTPYLSPSPSNYSPAPFTTNVLHFSPPTGNFSDMACLGSSHTSPSILPPTSAASATSPSTDYNSPKQFTTYPVPKTQSCPNCHLAFARVADLERHIHTIHLRIRHHCKVPGCGDNAGKGYCRREKLRKHLRTVHAML